MSADPDSMLHLLQVGPPNCIQRCAHGSTPS